MTFRLPLLAAAALIGTLAANPAWSRSTPAALQVTHAFARATAPGQPAAAVYLTIENKGTKNDRLITVSTPAAHAGAIHTMSMTGDVMHMREIGSVDVKAGEKLEMAPGDGYHIMLTGLRQKLVAGQSIPLQLRFQQAGTITVKVAVEAVAAKP